MLTIAAGMRLVCIDFALVDIFVGTLPVLAEVIEVSVLSLKLFDVAIVRPTFNLQQRCTYLLVFAFFYLVIGCLVALKTNVVGLDDHYTHNFTLYLVRYFVSLQYTFVYAYLLALTVCWSAPVLYY